MKLAEAILRRLSDALGKCRDTPARRVQEEFWDIHGPYLLAGDPEAFERAWPSMMQQIMEERYRSRQDRVEDLFA